MGSLITEEREIDVEFFIFHFVSLALCEVFSNDGSHHIEVCYWFRQFRVWQQMDFNILLYGQKKQS